MIQIYMCRIIGYTLAIVGLISVIYVSVGLYIVHRINQVDNDIINGINKKYLDL